MNKKTKTKILTLSAVSALSLAAIWVLASNANNLLFEWAVKQDAHLELSRLSLTTDPTTPQATSKSDVFWTVNDGKLITYTGTNTSTNQISANGTLSFWGSNNNTRDPESLILGGSGNTINSEAKNTIILASDKIQVERGSGSVVLGSTNARISGLWHILRATHWASIFGNDNITLAADNVKIHANNSIAIGSGIYIKHHDGSFVFNGTSNPVTTSKDHTAIIKANNGMIINANTKTADKTDLTINGSLQVGNSQIDTDGAIIYNDNCLQLKNTKLGRIGLNCPNTTNTESPFLSFGEVECGKNAKHYEINDKQTTWPLGSENSDFCSKGNLDGQAPTFFTSEERAAAYKTRGGSYASEGFGYTFHICFNEQDPTCAIPKLKKSWTCSEPNGNRLHCQATQDSGKKGQKTDSTPVSCPSGQHLENGQCVSNKKTVDCNKDGIDAANGKINNPQVSVTRSEATKSWSKPAKCELTCNTEYRKNVDSNSHNVYCANKPKCWDGEYYNPTTKTCESRCIWQYGYEDAGYSYQEKENSWWACFSTQEYSEEDHYQSYRFDYYEKIFGQFTKDDCLSRGYQWGVPIEQRYSPSNSVSQYVTKLYKSCQDYDPRYCKKVYNEQDLRECSDFSTEESCREEQSCDWRL